MRGTLHCTASMPLRVGLKLRSVLGTCARGPSAIGVYCTVMRWIDQLELATWCDGKDIQGFFLDASLAVGNFALSTQLSSTRKACHHGPFLIRAVLLVAPAPLKAPIASSSLLPSLLPSPRHRHKHLYSVRNTSAQMYCKYY